LKRRIGVYSNFFKRDTGLIVMRQWSVSYYEKQERRKAMYNVRRINIGKTEQLNELAHACGELYTQTVVFALRGPFDTKASGLNQST
jgi:hypothetical protein